MEYVQIVDWKKFQHYKDRNPPWIKLHAEILSDYDFCCLQDDSKLLLILLWILASKLDNKIPNDTKWIKEQIHIDKDVCLQPLFVKGFIALLPTEDSIAIARCAQGAIPETEAKKRHIKRGEGEQISPTLQQVKDTGFKVGITEQQAVKWYEHYAAQGFVFGGGLPITNLEAALVRWRNNQYKFEQKEKPSKAKLFPIKGKICGKGDCKLPAVYKDSSGAYDSFSCSDHMPVSVKERYQ